MFSAEGFLLQNETLAFCYPALIAVAQYSGLTMLFVHCGLILGKDQAIRQLSVKASFCKEY